MLLRDMVFLLPLCPQGAVTHVLGMQSLREQSLTQSLVALALQRQGTKICVLNVSEVGKPVGSEEKVAPRQFAVVDASLNVAPVMVIRESHNVSSMFVVDFIGEFGNIVCPFKTVISRQRTSLLPWLISQHLRKRYPVLAPQLLQFGRRPAPRRVRPCFLIQPEIIGQ
jgi:hypothetical protein